jgi:hypothetical protein
MPSAYEPQYDQNQSVGALIDIRGSAEVVQTMRNVTLVILWFQRTGEKRIEEVPICAITQPK